MEMKCLVLVSAVAFLVAPAFLSPSNRHKAEDNLKHIFDLAEKEKQNLTKRYFVEDVQDLHDSGCKDEFFCKVHKILHDHQPFRQNNNARIVMNLEVFINTTKLDCPSLLKSVKGSEVSKPVLDLLDFLTKCIQRRNFIGETTPQPKTTP